MGVGKCGDGRPGIQAGSRAGTLTRDSVGMDLGPPTSDSGEWWWTPSIPFTFPCPR